MIGTAKAFNIKTNEVGYKVTGEEEKRNNKKIRILFIVNQGLIYENQEDIRYWDEPMENSI